MIRRVDHVLQDPTALVALLVAWQVVAWTLAPSVSHTAPPVDVVESYMWGREWVLATYKHPAMPAWALEASRIVTGAVGWPAYLVSQLFIAATFVLVFLLGRDLLGPQRAAAGTLLLTGIFYYSWPTPEFNHNIAQLPFWAGTAWALWRAVERRSALWWALAGAFAAGGLYAKLATVLLLAAAAAWILLDVRARGCLATAGPWIGLGVFLALAAPLGLWMARHGFVQLDYLAQRTHYTKPFAVPRFLLGGLATLSVLLAMLAVARLIPLKRGEVAGASPPADRRAVLFLAVLNAGPPLFAVGAAALAGAGLKPTWASSMFNLAGLLAVALTAGRFNLDALRRIALFAAALLVVLPLAYAIVVGVIPRGTAPPLRQQWPRAEIAERMAGIWTRSTGAPLRIVAGENWIAGLVGLTHKDRPSLLSNGDVKYSPWISQARLEAEGMLVLWDQEKIPLELHPYIVPHLPVAKLERFRSRTSTREILVGYLIVPPKPARR